MPTVALAMTCPRCGLPDVDDASCPRCGVVFAKLAAREQGPAPAAPRPAGPAPPEPDRRGSPMAWVMLALGVVVLGAGIAVTRPTKAPPPAAAERGSGPAPAGPPAAPEQFLPPSLPSAEALADTTPIDVGRTGLAAADRQAVALLSSRLGVAGPAEVQQAEDLYARYASEGEVRRLLEAVLMNAAQRARASRRLDQAVPWLQRAAGLAQDGRPWLALTQALAEQSDWPGAEAAARGALAIEPRNAWAWQALGFALLRQDRSREAEEALETALGIQEDPGTRALLARVQKGLRDEGGMRQQTLSRFHVRYDGGEHESVGREILRALERHYATLAGTFDHQPATAIPVVLFTQEAYYDASGAPAWAGGSYDGIDGRIRIPIGGLTPRLTPDIDETLIHELTHAFVADRTRGVAPRDLHEGLAQYMEGKRAEALLGAEGMRALADGRIPGVGGFYVGALAFVEHLIALRGMGGVNDLLRAMGETGSVELAFRRVHGHGHNEARRLWTQRLQQQYGS